MMSKLTYMTYYHYFGARYYDSELSVFVSVDAMSDNNPSITPYHYCSNNPIMRIDPDGNQDGPWARVYRRAHRGGLKNIIKRLFSKPTMGPLGHIRFAFSGLRRVPGGRYVRARMNLNGRTAQSNSITSRQLANSFGEGYKLKRISFVGNRGSWRNSFRLKVLNYRGNSLARSDFWGSARFTLRTPFNGPTGPYFQGSSGFLRILQPFFDSGMLLYLLKLSNQSIPGGSLRNTVALKFNIRQRNQNAGATYNLNIRAKQWRRIPLRFRSRFIQWLY